MNRVAARPGHLVVLLGLITILLVPAGPVSAAPEGRSEAPAGQMTWAVHTTLVPTWFDPAETIQGTPFMVLLATHDALVKPMPGRSMAPSLAESWSTSADGLVYEFVLRKGAKFHIPTSTACSGNRPRSSIARSARRSSIECSS
jgi:ABC-type transport system substrate-binding protein